MLACRLFAAAALVAVLSGCSGHGELQVVGAADRVAWRGPIEPGETFDVAFTHSQEGGRWVQHYVASDRGIEQRSSSFPSFGAGMPVESADGSAIGHTPQAYTVAAPARIGDLPMMNSDAAAITLTYRGHQVSLGVFFDDFERFTIRIR